MGYSALNISTATYTPTWTSSGTPPAIGNGTITGTYQRVGNRIDVTIKLTTGASTTFGSANLWIFSLPTTASSIDYIGGTAFAFNSGVNFYTGGLRPTSTTTFGIYTSGGVATGWQSNVPAAWGGAGSTYIIINVSYFE